MRATAVAALVWLSIGLCYGLNSRAAEPAKEPTPDPRERFADPATPLPRVPFDGGKFAVRSGEVIVFTGSANAVFEQQQGWLESLLATAAARQEPKIRHMSWEGDTVYEQTRAMNFGGWGEQFSAVGASTIVAWFGQLEALDDSHDDAAFAAACDKLLAEFQQATPRLVVVSPPPFEKPASPWIPDNTPRNARVKTLTEIAGKLAQARGAVFVDVFTPLSARGPNQPRLTDDGMHFTPAGQRVAAEAIAAGLGIDVRYSDRLEPLRHEIVHKNRLWFDCWRTMNWMFPYGDRTWAPFSKPFGEHPSLAKELEQYKPLVRAADDRIHAIALGRVPPAAPEVPPPPAEKIHPPDEELQAFVPADGFEMNLWASEANGLVKPVQFTWDERGRLWALCAPSYPQLIPGIAANDFILVCEDTDGDGRADKFDRFAEGLVMPTGLVLGDGGVYLCETTQLVHLADTDGDGHADSRRVIFSGFGTGDSHQMINSICWGPDGRLWFTQGLHIFSTIETPRGLVKCSQTGIWRLNPRTLELQNFLGNAAATENAWGVGFDDWGQTFYNPGNQPNCVYLDPALAPVPSKYLTKNQYAPVGSLAVSKSKGMEIEFLGSSHLPDELQGLMVKSIYFASYIDLHELVDDGSGFGSLPRGDLVSSTSTLFRPLETKTGPDGAIYICDWCNPIIGHYQASYRDPARDHSHGRIWRMTAKNRPLVKRPPLEKMSTTELIEQLRSPERWVRGQAQEQLYRLPSNEVVKAGDDRLDSIILARRARTDDRLAAAAVPAPAGPGVKYAGVPADAAEQNEHLLYELTGVFAAHEAVRPALVELLCTSPEPRLRAFGTHMIGLWADRLSDPLELLARMAVDEFPRVRMEAAVAASYVRSPRAMEVATLVLNKPHDRFIDYALTQTVLTLRPEWFPAVAKGELSFDNQPDRLAFVLAADGTAEGARLVRQFSERPELSDDARARSWALLARAGDADDLRYALDHGLRHAAVLDALAVAASQRGKVPSGELAEPLRPLMAAEDDALRGAAIRLAGAWRLKSLAPAIREQVERGGGEGSRLAAIGAIATIEGHDALPLLTPLIEAKHPQPVRAAAIKAIAAIDLVKAAQSTADEMTDIKDQAVMADFVLPVVDRQGGAKLLADALEKKSLTADPAKLAHRALSANGHAEPALVTVLNRAIGISAGQVEYSPQVVARLAETVTEQGDARKGRDLFLSKLANCTACHKVAGQGGDIGPDLSVVGAGLPLPLIIESLLWPNRQVKEGYAATRVVTSDGQILVGYKLKDTPEEVQLREIATREVRRIAREDIEEMAGVGSVMPAGLTVGMTSEEVRDLVRYLSELGRGSR